MRFRYYLRNTLFLAFFAALSHSAAAQQIVKQIDSSPPASFAVNATTGDYFVATDEAGNGGTVVKYATDGTELWTYPLEKAHFVEVSGSSIFVAGPDSIVMLTESGSMVWEAGGFSNILDLAADANGSVLVLSLVGGVLRVDRVDTDGSPATVVEIEGVDHDFRFGQGPSLAVGGSGRIYVAGSFKGTVDFDAGGSAFNLTSAGVSDAFLAWYESDGSFVDAFRVGSSDGDEVAHDLAISGEHVYLTGFFDGSVDFDPGTGTVVLDSPACYDAFVATYKLDGSLVWARNIGGADGCAEANGYGIAVDGSDNVYLTGYFFNSQSSKVDFDPGPAEQFLNYTAEEDGFVASYDANGDLRWAHAISSSMPAFGYDVEISGTDEISVLAQGRGEITFYPNSVTVDGGDYLVLARYRSDGSVISSNEKAEFPDHRLQWVAYPNPAGDYISARLSVSHRDVVKVSIFDILGREVAPVFRGDVLDSRDFKIGLSDLPAGMYLLRVTGEREQEDILFVHVR